MEYEYTVSRCDMRTRKSRRLKKYEWNASVESLFGLATEYGFIIKIEPFGEVRLIAPNGKNAYDFYRLITDNHMIGIKVKMLSL